MANKKVEYFQQFYVFVFPASIPAVMLTKVKVLNSKSLLVNWTSVTAPTITGYKICYQSTTGVDCSDSNVEKKAVTGREITSTTITGLNEYTDYYVAGAAVSGTDVGPTGNEIRGTTNQDSKYAYFRA